MARLLLLSEHSRKVFETRVDPLVKFDKEKFHSRYRLSKEVVLDLAEDFGRSRFASTGVKTEIGQYWFLRTSAPWEVLVRNQSALVRIFTIP